jgi:hypothetical protein
LELYFDHKKRKKKKKGERENTPIKGNNGNIVNVFSLSISINLCMLELDYIRYLN